MDAMGVLKPDMAVVRQGPSGLSPFGLLSRLFEEELARRTQQRLGGYNPLDLTLLEEAPAEEAESRPPLQVNVNLDVRLDQPAKGEGQPAVPNPAQVRLVEKVLLRERQLRETRQELHRLELRLEALPEQLAARRMPLSARVLTLASREAAAPAAGGWTPQVRQAHPGYPAEQETPHREGSSILLPDVLRRRREEALEAARNPAAPRPADRSEGAEALLRRVREAVERTVAEDLRRLRREPTAAPDAEREDGPSGLASGGPERRDALPREHTLPAGETSAAGRPPAGAPDAVRQPVGLHETQASRPQWEETPLQHREASPERPATGESDSDAVRPARTEVRRGSEAPAARRETPAAPAARESESPAAGPTLRRDIDLADGNRRAAAAAVPPSDDERARSHPRGPETERAGDAPAASAEEPRAAVGVPAEGGAAEGAAGKPPARPADGALPPAEEALVFRAPEAGAPTPQAAGEPDTEPPPRVDRQRRSSEPSPESGKPHPERRPSRPSSADAPGRAVSAPETAGRQEPTPTGREAGFPPSGPAADGQSPQQPAALGSPGSGGDGPLPETMLIHREADAAPGSAPAGTNREYAAGPLVSRENRSSQPMELAADASGSVRGTETDAVDAGRASPSGTAPVPGDAGQFPPAEHLVHRETERDAALPGATAGREGLRRPEAAPPGAEPETSMPAGAERMAVPPAAAMPAPAPRPEEPLVYREAGRVEATPAGTAPPAGGDSRKLGNAESPGMARGEPAETVPAQPGRAAGLAAERRPEGRQTAPFGGAVLTAPGTPAESRPAAPEPLVHRETAAGAAQGGETPEAPRTEPAAGGIAERRPAGLAPEAALPVGVPAVTGVPDGQPLPAEPLVHRETAAGAAEGGEPPEASRTGPAAGGIAERRTAGLASEAALPAGVPAMTGVAAGRPLPAEPLVYREPEPGPAAVGGAEPPTQAARRGAAEAVRVSAVQHTERLRTAPAAASDREATAEPAAAADVPAFPAAPSRTLPTAAPLVYRAPDAASGERAADGVPAAREADGAAAARGPMAAREAATARRRTGVLPAFPSARPVSRDIRTSSALARPAETARPQEPPNLTLAMPARDETPARQDRQALPDWAQALLEKGPLPGRDAVRQTSPAAVQRQIQWTAPQPAAAPAPPTVAADLRHRERREPEPTPFQTRVQQELEVRRTAEKVYRIIEERLRKELRRSGR